MAVKKILRWPNPILSQKSKIIQKLDTSIECLFQDLVDTMQKTGNAVGLAAPQIGVLLKMFIINIAPESNNNNGTNGIEAFINPELIFREGEFEWEEGCLSIPGEYGKTKRATRIIVRYMDLNWKIKEREALDFFSGCLQHEIDHLYGTLWVDYQSSLKRELIFKKMKKKMHK